RRPGEGAFGADGDGVDGAPAGRGHHVRQGGPRGSEVGAELGGGGVAGGGEEGRGGGGEVAFERPGERVLAAAPADDQDSHFFLYASEKAWAARFAPSTTSFTAAFASFI